MRFLSSCRRFGFVFFLTVSVALASFPQAVAAANIDTLLPQAADEVLTRGDFLRAAIEALGIDHDSDAQGTLPFDRVSDAMKPYVSAALRENALGAYGTELHLSKSVTRGEALRVVSDLLDTKSVKAVNFRDVRKGTSLDAAVRAAMDYGWMTPTRSNFFGAQRPLAASEARELLRKASAGTAGSTQKDDEDLQTIRINVKPKSSSDSTLPKQEVMQSVWNLLNSEYLYQDKIDQEKAAYAAIEAIVNSVDDPYTKFLRPASAASFQTQIQGEITGIGAQVEEIEGVITVVTPLVGSPAEAAGVKPGDKIIAADGVSLSGMSFTDAVDKIRGPKGSTVELTIRRDAGEIKLKVKRDVIKVPEISIKWQDKVAVVRLMQFGRLTETDLRGDLEKVQVKKPKGIILDLRNNPGGLLTAADAVLSNFLPKGSAVAIIKSQNDERTEITPLIPTIDPSVPVVVLINGGSASASEIVAGALRDHKRAKIIGEKSFGKGTVQAVIQMKDGSNLKVTTAEWMTPSGAKIDGIGVEPDIRVKFSSDRDEQLLRALELLR